MLTRKKRKIIKIILISLISFFLTISFIIYFLILGPFRTFFWNLPSMLGFFGSRNYLMVLQNNNELRPTGGFITGVADLHLFFGIPTLTFMDSYEIPDPKPKIPAPEPFEYFIGSRDPFFAGWTLRDANFSPDTETSAKAIIERYEAAFPEKKMDGVFFIDFSVLEALLRHYGPVNVEGVRFDAEHFFLQSQRLSKDIDTHNIDELKNRKNIFKPFAQSLISQILWSPFRYRSLMTRLAVLGEQKHVQLFFTSPKLQHKVASGQLVTVLSPPSPEQDFLMINVANIGGRKADRYVRKNISYRVDLSDAKKREGHMTIDFEHLGTYNLQSDIYQAYVRVYTPPGTVLLSSRGTPLRLTKISQEHGLNVYSDILRLSPGENIRLQYDYMLPQNLTTDDYHLTVLKQAGTDDVGFQLALQMPNDATLLQETKNDHQKMLLRENVGLFDGTLKNDLHFHVSKIADAEPPLILWQEFKSLSLINVRFQEELEKREAEDMTNYSFEDLNEKNIEVKDQVKITKARFENRDLWLILEGVTEQKEEHYGLTLRDLKDESGNVITPNPVTRTLVQRISTKP